MNRFLTTGIAFAIIIFIAAHIGFYKKYIALFPGLIWFPTKCRISLADWAAERK